MNENEKETLNFTTEINANEFNSELENLTKRAVALFNSINRVKMEKNELNKHLREYQEQFDECMEQISFLKEPNLFNQKQGS